MSLIYLTRVAMHSFFRRREYHRIRGKGRLTCGRHLLREVLGRPEVERVGSYGGYLPISVHHLSSPLIVRFL